MKEQYRVQHPDFVNHKILKRWCDKNLNGRVKTVYQKKYDEQKKKWVRDYSKPLSYRFQDEDDAMAFKLRWTG